MKKNNVLFWIIFFIGMFPALIGIFHAGFFVSDDGHWMAIRLSAFYEALASGQFPVRFLPRLNQGLGYPVADFLYPLFLYIGSFLHLLKFSFLLSTKLLFAGSIVVSGIGMTIFLRRKFNNIASFIGGIFYIYLPYHLYDVYTRGSLGEVVALAVVPWILWALEKQSVVLSAIFFSLLILSHNTLALFFLPIITLYALVKKMAPLRVVLFVFLGLCIAAFFWIPALYDKQYTVFDSIAVANPFSYFVNSVSYGLIGWIGIAIIGGAFFFYQTWKRKDVLFFVILTIVSLFFSLSPSAIFWHSKLLSEFIQFPFRFLSLTIVAEAFLVAYIVDIARHKYTIIAILFLLLGFSSWSYLFPSKYDYVPNSFYATNVDTTTVKNEYMPIWIHSLPQKYVYQRIQLAKKTGTILQATEKGTHIRLVVSMKQKSNIRIAFVYFPGWQVKIDGKKEKVSLDKKTGLLQLSVPDGKHTVDVWFGETPVRMIADTISLLALADVFFLLIKKYYEK